MSASRAWTCSVVGALLGALLTAGCGGSGNAGAQTVPAAAEAGPTSLPSADARACVGVQAVISHITADTARWSPKLQPFDQVIAQRLSGQARVLASQASFASGRAVVGAVRATAAAFDGVARAMKAKSRPKFRRAIDNSRTAYAILKKVCLLE